MKLGGMKLGDMKLGDMNLMSRLTQRQMRLDPPLTRDLIVERDLPVPMPDGVVLLADRWAPRVGGDSLPVALIRTPYGRGAMLSAGMVRPLAERGFQVVLQSVRGTFGSGGTFEPMRNEREDGLATLDWLVKQPWFGDSIVLVGASYMGAVQWAVADRLPPEVKALIPQITESGLTLEFLRPDAFSLETPFGWGVMIDGQERRGALLRQIMSTKKNERAMRTVPLAQADVAAIGHHTQFTQDILDHDADDPYWAPTNHRDRVAEVTVPVSSTGGWYDIFLPRQLRDFMVLQDAGRTARLTIGPWTHVSVDGAVMREAIEFGLACARGEELPPRKPVRLYVMGENAWREFESWPPPGYPPQSFYLAADGALASEPPGESAPDAYRYDPADPTPAVGGVRLVFRGAGRVDNAKLEARPDVLTYTTAPLESDVEVIGEVSAQIWFQSSLPQADVFVRLCDVDPAGKSWNICDGLTSVSGADELAAVTVRLWPTAYRFKRGHRIRVQVSSGAFPRYARNPGTGDPRATATRLLAANQSVHHDQEHPSAITLPVRESRASPGRQLARDVRSALMNLPQAAPPAVRPAPPADSGRNRYADLLRVGAFSMVVSGHWLLTDITYRGGMLSGLDALDYINWGRWVTLVFQVMPVFFVVGGYVNARSWAAHHEQGEGWAEWVRSRAMRLLWPTVVYVVVGVVAFAAARMAGASTAELAPAGWLVAFQLWFLPVYLLLIVATPVLLAAHRRWGLSVPAVMAAAAAAVDVGVIGHHLPLVGYANYLLVWGAMHQWGFAWQDGTLTRARWRPWALAAGGAAVLAALLTWGPFPVDMIGANERIGNTTPPSIALLAFAAAQTGLVLAAEPVASRWLARPRRWRLVTRLNGTAMTVYLWHMVPVVVVAVALYPTAVMPQPAIGSAQWWLTRPAWLGACALILALIVVVVMRVERPVLRLPNGLATAGRRSGPLLLVGIAATMFGLTRLAIAGFDPGGAVPALALAAFGCGIACTLLSGRSPPATTPASP